MPGVSSTEEGEPPEEDEEESAGAPAKEEAPPDPLAEAQAERDRFREQMLRTAADFENYRKRSRREIEEATLRGRDGMLRELLPVLDNFERALEHAAAGGDSTAVLAGLTMVQKLLGDTLQRAGLEALGEEGVPFDPAIHDALGQEQTEEFAPGTVVKVVQKGYRAGERLIRPAAVVVAIARTEPHSDDEKPKGAPEEEAGD